MASDFFKKKAADIAKAAKDAAGKVEDAAGQVAGAVAEKAGEVLDELKSDKEVVVYPTYGYRKGVDEGTWVIPVRVWVSKARRLPVSDEVVGVFVSDMGALDADDIARLRSRIKSFVADDDSREAVSVKFDADPEGRTYQLPGVTDPNGLIQHDLEIPDAKARTLLEAQGSAAGWLSFTASAEGFEGPGRARMVEPEGLSVISDIDDTIKVTEVPAGKRIVLRNTFLREYAAAAGMAERYRAFGDGVMFHYVSGSPWQLYKLLGEFVGASYPEGAFHMKDVRKNLLVHESWHDFKNFAAGDAATFEQKVGQISRVMLNLPRRDFVLVGDSGEKDPEVFRETRKTFGPRVREIFIRDVVDERHKPNSNRLEGMNVIEAPTVVHGVTQFTD
jgi:phosphatidate phosphatase APP1